MRKKERVAKLKSNNEIGEELKRAIDPIYNQAVVHLDKTA